MLKSFELRDGALADRQVGTFNYDAIAKRFEITIAQDVVATDLPLSLEGYALKGVYTLTHEDALRWIRARICPPSRHNIRELLSDNDLQEYDEFGLIMATRARCDKDDLYLA